MFELYDTFNGHTISRHRSIEAAVKADRKFQRAVKRANGDSSYIPTQIREDGKAIDENDYYAACGHVDAERLGL